MEPRCAPAHGGGRPGVRERGVAAGARCGEWRAPGSGRRAVRFRAPRPRDRASTRARGSRPVARRGRKDVATTARAVVVPRAGDERDARVAGGCPCLPLRRGGRSHRQRSLARVGVGGGLRPVSHRGQREGATALHPVRSSARLPHVRRGTSEARGRSLVPREPGDRDCRRSSRRPC